MRKSFVVNDGVPRVYPSETSLKTIYKHFQDYHGKFFWKAFEVYEKDFLALWSIDNFKKNNIVFDPKNMIVDNMVVRKLRKEGNSYVASIFISTPALNAKLLKEIIRQKTKGGAGCSNKGKYSDVPEEYFCGPEGGACDGTYPVNTPGRWRAAKAYAHNAPNPQGIKDCADRIAVREGWKK